MFKNTAGCSLRPWCSDRHLSCTVGGVALLPGVVIVGGLRGVLHLYVLPLTCPSSASSIHPHIGLAKEIRQVFCALLPLARVAVSPGGAVHGGGGLSGGGGLPVDVAGSWLPGFEGRAGEQWVSGCLGNPRVLQVARGDGDGERGVKVVMRRHGLVDV